MYYRESTASFSQESFVSQVFYLLYVISLLFYLNKSYLKEKKITTIFATHDSSDVLSFADEVLVIKDGQLIEEGNPKSIYNYPKNKYIASLFGDVNEIELDGKIELIYPDQLNIVEKSGLKVKVVKSYFLGSHYLIEAIYNDRKIFS